jgi:hypothetical protein
MKKKMYLKIVFGIITFMIIMKIITIFFVERLIAEKLISSLCEKNKNYKLNISRVHVLFISRGMEIEGITIKSVPESGSDHDLNGEIESIGFKGLSLTKAIFSKKIDVRKVTIINSGISGKIPAPEGKIGSIVIPVNMHIGILLFDKINLSLEKAGTSQSFLVEKGVLNVYDLNYEKEDTLSICILSKFDLMAEEIRAVSPDSMYTFITSNINYRATEKSLVVKCLVIQPNYKDYDFTSQYKYQKDRIAATFINISLTAFDAAGYLVSGNFVSSYIEINEMTLNMFRDNRKEFRHINKPAFQDMIYNFPGGLHIDSIRLLSGDIRYSERAQIANEEGSLSFNKIKVLISNICNDTIHKTEGKFLMLNADALVMGKGKLAIMLKSKMHDKNNTFSVNGELSDIDIKELNPFLANNGFIYATSGKIDKLTFSFSADNKKAAGNMIVLYHGLDVAVKNKRTDDTTALREKLISSIANIKLQDSNPMPGEEVRVGIIDYERNPEKFLFNYCAKSIMTGVKSSLIKKHKK